MTSVSDADKRQKRIAHIKSHLDIGFQVPKLVHNVETGEGNPRACVLSLASHAQASAMYSWFASGNLEAMRQWCYVAGRLRAKHFLMADEKINAGNYVYLLLWPLLSNDDALVDWYASYEQRFADNQLVDEIGTADYRAYSAFLALKGAWTSLERRSERVLSEPTTPGYLERFAPDHEFHLALAKGEMEQMQGAIDKLIVPETVKLRGEEETGFTQDLISTLGCVYTKIALRHGYPIQSHSALVPAEWLSDEKNSCYWGHYKFLEPRTSIKERASNLWSTLLGRQQ